MATRRQMCGTGTHRLKGAGVPITEPKYVKFLKLCNQDFRSGWLICEKCVDYLKRTYRYKIKRAIEQRYGVTDVSSVQTSANSTSSQDSIDRLVLKTPLNPNLTNHCKTKTTNRTTQSETTAGSDSNSEAQLFTNFSTSLAETSEEINASQLLEVEIEPTVAATPVQSNRSRTEKRTLETNQPSNANKTATLQTKTAAQAHIVGTSDNTDDDEYIPSPNALNGTRLPNIQPIPKRRKVPANGFNYQQYVKDITGG